MAEHASSKPILPDDALPPVEPPSAGFLVQLFVIPGVIVIIIVAVWLLFHWLAQMGNDPRKYVETLRGHGEARWQAAVNLAGALRNPANDAIRQDTKMAGDLAQILRDEIASGGMEERQLNVRVFLCLALGQFTTDTGLPVLLEALSTERAPAEAAVRLAALKAIGDLAVNVRSAGGALRDPEMSKSLLAVSRDGDAPLKAAAALALGAVGGTQAEERLAQMVNDSDAQVRYDAAVALANTGNAAALETLLEMLAAEPFDTPGDAQGSDPAARRTLIQVNGLRGIARLADANAELDLSAATAAVDRLAGSGGPEVRDHALAVKQKLARRASPAATAPQK